MSDPRHDGSGLLWLFLILFGLSTIIRQYQIEAEIIRLAARFEKMDMRLDNHIFKLSP